jgi:hypothetical protein
MANALQTGIYSVQYTILKCPSEDKALITQAGF